MTETTTQEIEDALQALSLTSSATPNPSAIKTLSTASRTSEATREALNNPSIIRNIIETIEISLTTDLETTDQALRLLANACVSTSTADSQPGPRDHITAIGFSWAIQCLSSQISSDEDIRILTTKVLRNICSEHESSQKKCYEEKVHFALVGFLQNVLVSREETGEGGREDVDAGVDVLFTIMGQKGTLEPKLNERLPKDVLEGVLVLSDLWTGDGEDDDVESFATIAETELVFLRDEVVQTQIVEERQFEKVWALLEKIENVIGELKRAESRVTEVGSGDERPLPPYCQNGDLEEDLKLLVPLQASLVWCLSDIAANPAFSAAYAWDGEQMQFLLHVIQAAADNARGQTRQKYPAGFVGTSAAGQKFNAACQVLGNLLWAQKEPQQCARLVDDEGLHKDLIDIIALGGYDAAFPDTLHSIAGLLIQLSRPSLEAREAIGSYGPASDAIERLCRHERPEIKQGGIKLVKALGRDCHANQRRFADLAGVAMAGLQPSSGDHSGDTDSVMATDGQS
ncbi:hypothetical protein CKM354_000912100 [Cercospora kikuchii]|uniref:Uncharacterized protein n=1 Tax=Cercospora kikuchii TaxID=84275 RepID=A0A9P3FIZ6_9PEZI|nr:uncharacterized protein CKM354_000912100 [Cercospora kikuchii]GIZ45977.1 hypothetical protein CKM354_000912100 [Cercospora kikuchii]